MVSYLLKIRVVSPILEYINAEQQFVSRDGSVIITESIIFAKFSPGINLLKMTVSIWDFENPINVGIMMLTSQKQSQP
jgi:hypothetical protein